MTARIGHFFYRIGRWIYKYNILKEPYDKEAREYLTHEKLRIGQRYWETMEQEKKDELMSVSAPQVVALAHASIVRPHTSE